MNHLSQKWKDLNGQQKGAFMGVAGALLGAVGGLIGLIFNGGSLLTPLWALLCAAWAWSTFELHADIRKLKE